MSAPNGDDGGGSTHAKRRSFAHALLRFDDNLTQKLLEKETFSLVGSFEHNTAVALHQHLRTILELQQNAAFGRLNLALGGQGRSTKRIHGSALRRSKRDFALDFSHHSGTNGENGLLLGSGLGGGHDQNTYHHQRNQHPFCACHLIISDGASTPVLAGKWISNTVLDCSLFTCTEPPCFSAMRLTNARPRPQPGLAVSTSCAR